MNTSIADIRSAIEIVIGEIYPNVSTLDGGHYSLNDILDQLIFELIKEEYKKYARKRPIQYYLDLYDNEHYGTSRKYTRALQYAQFYKDFDNEYIEETFGFRLSELEAQDVTGNKVFSGYQFTEWEFLQFKMQAECRLLNKLHGKQLDNSRNVTENAFRKLFEEYSNCITELEPQLNANPEHVISSVLTYYGMETHFLTEFLYQLTLSAEKIDFPKEVHIDRVLAVYALLNSFVFPSTLLAEASSSSGVTSKIVDAMIVSPFIFEVLQILNFRTSTRQLALLHAGLRVEYGLHSILLWMTDLITDFWFCTFPNAEYEVSL